MEYLIEKAMVSYMEKKNEKKGIEKDFPNLHQFYYNIFELKQELYYIIEKDVKEGNDEVEMYLKKKKR